MKQNWQYKKLKDICNILYGYPFESSLFSSYPGDGMPLIRIRDVKNGFTETYYKGNYPKDYIIKKGDYLIGMDGEFNIADWKSEDALLNQRVCKLFTNNPEINIKFIYRFLTKELKKIEDETPFVTVKHLSAKRINQINVYIPPLDEQERIVKELDLLSGIIEKQKQQLRELDTLAQSIFYSMFGDPVLNEKGWKKEKLGKNNEISSAKRVLVQDVVDTGVPFIRGTELAVLSKQNIFDLNIFSMFITKEHYEKVKAITGVPQINDLLIPSINPDGLIWEVSTSSPFYFKDGRVIWVHVNHDILSSKWLRFALSKIISEKYNNLSRGAVFTELTLVFIRNIEIPVPPISLQNEFADKIEKIEKQKEAINKSIEETQKLFDYSMDKYFS